MRLKRDKKIVRNITLNILDHIFVNYAAFGPTFRKQKLSQVVMIICMHLMCEHTCTHTQLYLWYNVLDIHVYIYVELFYIPCPTLGLNVGSLNLVLWMLPC